MINLLPDITILPMWVIFMVVMSILSRFVFKPTLDLMEKREEQTDKLKDTAGDLLQENKELAEDYQTQLIQARQAAAKARESFIEEARSEEKRLVEAARQENEAQMASLQSKIKEEVGQAKTEIQNYADNLSQLIVAKVLEK